MLYLLVSNQFFVLADNETNKGWTLRSNIDLGRSISTVGFGFSATLCRMHVHNLGP